jgi:hypothetical protein
MGALLTLLAVGIDPTVQQAIAIRTRNKDDVRQAHIPRAQSFVQFGSSEIAGDRNIWPTSSFMGFIFSAIFSGPSQVGKTSSDIVADCPTGNCNFPVYQTLAVCSECENITDLVGTSCFEWTDGDHMGWQTCRSQLPNSLHINQTVSTDDKLDLSYGLTVSTSTYLPLTKPMPRGIDIMRWSVINGTMSANNLSLSASQCLLYWCIKTLKGRVVDGLLAEEELDSWYDKDARIDVNLTKLDALSQTINLTAPLKGSSALSSPFAIGTAAHADLVDLLTKSLSFSNSLAPLVNSTTTILELEPDASNNFSRNSYFGNINYSTNLPLFQVLCQVLGYGPAGIVSNTAKAITAYIRTLSAEDQWRVSELDNITYPVLGIGPANGTAYTLQVYIHVRWAWISFTAAILSLTIVFLVLIMAQSARHNILIWKSSPLALLFHGLNAEEVLRSDKNDVADMYSRSKNMRVQLGNTASGVKLKNEVNLDGRIT